jgi:hypothetical protein
VSPGGAQLADGDDDAVRLEVPQRRDLLGGGERERLGRAGQDPFHVGRVEQHGDSAARNGQAQRSGAVPVAEPAQQPDAAPVDVEALGEAYDPVAAADHSLGGHRREDAARTPDRVEDPDGGRGTQPQAG